MKLKNKLLSQNMAILAITVAVTVLVGLFCSYLFTHLDRFQLHDEQMVLLQNEKIMYQSTAFDPIEVKDMEISHAAGGRFYTWRGVDYLLHVEPFVSVDGSDCKLIRLSPIINLNNYNNLLYSMMVAFLVTFLVAALVVQHRNKKDLAIPLSHLKQAAENLKSGDLQTAIATEGEAEIRDLCKSIEDLRICLADSVYMQKKYDENRKFLMSSISHDLRTPVTAIRGYIEGVLDGVADTAEKRTRYLTEALAKITLLNTMIEDLLLYSKLDLGQVPFSLERVSAADYMQECYRAHLLLFEQCGKELLFENRLEAPYEILIDERHFARVIQNILENAKKHTGENGVIKITLRETTGSVIIDITDNGHGIKKEELPHIFDRFYRGDNARKIEGSSGLGLAIAKQMVEGMDGRIWAISDEGGTSLLISMKKQ